VPNRVLITGLGLISPLGLTAKEHFERWRVGQSAVKPATHPHFESFPAQLEAPVIGYDRHAHISSRMLRKLLSPSAGMAVGAAGAALADARLKGEAAILESCGLYVGSLSLEIEPETFLPPLRASMTPQGLFDIGLFARRGTKILDPLFLVRALPNAGVCGVSVEHQVLGPNANLTNGTTSGLLAVGLAAAAIERGELDCALAGGYDTLLGMDNVAEHLIAGRLPQNGQAQACRPFEAGRDGYALGEGAAFVLLEAEEHAARRGAHAHATLLGWSQTTETTALRNPLDGSVLALEQAARQALQMAAVNPSTLEQVYGDGLGTQVDDQREALALQRLFGARPVGFSAPTRAIGFTGAGSGVFSLIHAALAISRAEPPWLVWPGPPDPACPVNLLERVSGDGRPALVWNSDLGVKNVAMVVGPYSP
jgi:3-oxoacyl-[acyl-carrier-protein] synthase II